MISGLSPCARRARSEEVGERRGRRWCAPILLLLPFIKRGGPAWALGCIASESGALGAIPSETHHMSSKKCYGNV